MKQSLRLLALLGLLLPTPLTTMARQAELRNAPLGVTAIERQALETEAMPSILAFRLLHENDFLTPFNDDDNYTGGLKVEFLTRRLKTKALPFFRFGKGRSLRTVVAGATAFTPQDIANPNVVTNDRPYGSYQFIGIGEHSISKNGRHSFYSELTIGEIGRNGVRDVQTYIHQRVTRNRPAPEGWQNQIGNGGRFAFNYYARYEHQFAIVNGNKGDNLSVFQPFWLSYFLEANGGLYMNWVGGGLTLSLLNWNHRWENAVLAEPGSVVKSMKFKDGSESTLDSEGRQQTSNRKNRLKAWTTRYFHGSLYLRPRVRYVIQNTMLQGYPINDNSVYTLPPSDMSRVLVEGEAGIRLRFHWFQMDYYVAVRSREFRMGKDLHYWGGLGLTFWFGGGH